jgi:hyperosmotically inducible periplasmic protein
MKSISKYLSTAAAIIALSFIGASAQAAASSQQKAGRSLEQQIHKTLVGLPNYGVFDHITFRTVDGMVVLSGKVYSLGTRSAATASVKRIPGVKGVVDEMVDLPPSPFDDTIRRQALRQFGEKGLGGYFWETNPDVRIIVENGHLTLEGYVMNSGDRNLLSIYANGITGVFSVQNNLIVGKESFR